MSDQLRQRLFAELDSIRLIDPHSHIEPKSAASKTLADILGYHYYTELMPLGRHAARARSKSRASIRRKKSAGWSRGSSRCETRFNTVGCWSWPATFFDFPADEHLTTANWESLYDTAAKKMAQPELGAAGARPHEARRRVPDQQLRRSARQASTRSATSPACGRTTWCSTSAKPEVRQRLEKATNTDVRDAASLRTAIGKLFEHFVAKGARACAISLPPTFRTDAVLDSNRPTRRSPPIVRNARRRSSDSRYRSRNFVFWTLAEFCAEFKLPFDLMIGVNRAVYRGGVYQGQDLYDSRVSLIQYKELFNAFPQVTFPISVLASVTNQELVSYAWIFPNVVTNGHWWYSNTPTYIEHDAAARLEAVPQTKQIGYYSDAYKLEFCLPKFAMYKRILAKILAERFVIDRGWSETAGRRPRPPRAARQRRTDLQHGLDTAATCF